MRLPALTVSSLLTRALIVSADDDAGASDLTPILFILFRLCKLCPNRVNIAPFAWKQVYRGSSSYLLLEERKRKIGAKLQNQF